MKNIFRPKGIVNARKVTEVGYGLDKFTGPRRAVAIAALIQDNNFIYRGELEVRCRRLAAL